MVDGIDARFPVPGGFSSGRLGDEELDVRRVDPADADGGRELTLHEHFGQVRPRSLHHVGGLAVLLNVFFVDHHPGDLVEVYAVLRRENPPRPDTGGDGVRAHAHLLALEIPRRLHAGLYVIDDRGMRELAQDEDRQRGERFIMGLGSQVRRNGHLAHVEVERAAHAAESADDRRDLDVVELDAGHRHGAILQAFCVRVGRDRGLENRHVILLLREALQLKTPIRFVLPQPFSGSRKIVSLPNDSARRRPWPCESRWHPSEPGTDNRKAPGQVPLTYP